MALEPAVDRKLSGSNSSSSNSSNNNNNNSSADSLLPVSALMTS